MSVVARLYSEEVVLPTAGARYQIRVTPNAHSSAAFRGTHYQLVVESEDADPEVPEIRVRPPYDGGVSTSRAMIHWPGIRNESNHALAEAFGEALVVAAGLARLLNEQAGL